MANREGLDQPGDEIVETEGIEGLRTVPHISYHIGIVVMLVGARLVLRGRASR